MESSTSIHTARLNRRRAIRLSYANALLWAIGNGLVSTTLILFLAIGFGAAPLAVSLVIASPRFVGLLRLWAPSLIQRVGDRRKFCLLTYISSSLLLLTLPLVAAVNWSPNSDLLIGVLVGVWAVYHLLEFLGMIALWSWLADIVPVSVRGRFIGQRNRWLVGGRLVGMVASGLFTYVWTASLPEGHSERWIAYAISATVGALFMGVAVVPLAFMPTIANSTSPGERFQWRWVWNVLVDRGYRRLIAYSGWMALFNGLTQVAQFIYPRRVLGFEYSHILVLRSGLRGGQSLVSPALGKIMDRQGSIPIMLACQVLVATGPLFFLFATPSQPWWIIVAYAVWIAYAGLNIGLPGLMLGLSPQQNDTRYIAVYFAASDLLYGIGTVCGGLLLSWLLQQDTAYKIGPLALDAFGVMFLFGFVARSFGVLLLSRIRPARLDA